MVCYLNFKTNLKACKTYPSSFSDINLTLHGNVAGNQTTQDKNDYTFRDIYRRAEAGGGGGAGGWWCR